MNLILYFHVIEGIEVDNCMRFDLTGGKWRTSLWFPANTFSLIHGGEKKKLPESFLFPLTLKKKNVPLGPSFPNFFTCKNINK